MLCELRHPNIVTLHAAYESPVRLYLVTELASGGELMRRLGSDTNRPVYSEDEARTVVVTLTRTPTLTLTLTFILAPTLTLNLTLTPTLTPTPTLTLTLPLPLGAQACAHHRGRRQVHARPRRGASRPQARERAPQILSNPNPNLLPRYCLTLTLTPSLTLIRCCSQTPRSPPRSGSSISASRDSSAPKSA